MTDDLTELDRAHVAMENGADPDRVRYYGCFADTELIVWLESEVAGESINPVTRELDGIACILAFDRDDRLAELVDRPVPTLRIPGRALASALAGSGLGIALNIGGAPSSNLLPPEAIEWVAGTISDRSGEIADTDRPIRLTVPSDIPGELANALGQRLAPVVNRTTGTFLTHAEYADGSRSLVLAVLGAPDWLEPAIRDAAREALVFSGLEGTLLDVLFLPESGELAVRVLRSSIRLDVETRMDVSLEPTAPGMNPDKPPRLN